MEIIDAQMHRTSPATPWSDSYSDAEKAVFDAELALQAMRAVGVDAAVIHFDPEFIEAAARHAPDKFAGIAQWRRPLEIGDPAEVIAGLRSRPGLLGFRLTLGWPPDEHVGARLTGSWTPGGNLLPALREGRFKPYFEAAQKHGVPVCVMAPGELHEFATIAREYPSLRLIIDHLGMLPPPAVSLTPNLLDDIPELLKLAEYPNVAVKFTGVAALSLEDYPFKDLWPAAHKVIEAFRPERLLWGSDYTRMTMRPGFEGSVRTYSELLDFLRYSGEVSESDKATMLSSSVRTWFCWDRPRA